MSEKLDWQVLALMGLSSVWIYVYIDLLESASLLHGSAVRELSG